MAFDIEYGESVYKGAEYKDVGIRNSKVKWSDLGLRGSWAVPTLQLEGETVTVVPGRELYGGLLWKSRGLQLRDTSNSRWPFQEQAQVKIPWAHSAPTWLPLGQAHAEARGPGILLRLCRSVCSGVRAVWRGVIMDVKGQTKCLA